VRSESSKPANHINFLPNTQAFTSGSKFSHGGGGGGGSGGGHLSMVARPAPRTGQRQFYAKPKS
jgi:hypothetical protein